MSDAYFKTVEYRTPEGAVHAESVTRAGHGEQVSLCGIRFDTKWKLTSEPVTCPDCRQEIERRGG